jgi:GT2 family glycosyltransferase
MTEKTKTGEIKRIVRLSWQTLKLFGVGFLLKEVIRYLRFGPLPVYNSDKYELFRETFLTNYTSEQIATMVEGFAHKPLISIITPVYNIDPKYLDLCIKSVLSQHYQNWELCLYDDCSTKEETRNCLREWIGVDHRIKVKLGNKNLHISLASNEAIGMSSGEYIALLDHDDELTPISLLEVVNEINKNPQTAVIYSDEDLIDEKSNYTSPHFKSDFNKALLLSHNYITHFLVVKRNVGEAIGWFRKGYEGSQDHDLLLRLIEKTSAIAHIPKILYHWRQTETSTAMNYTEKSYADDAAKKALADYAERNHIEAQILNGPGSGAYYFKRKIVTDKQVSIIIPFNDQVKLLKDCVESLIAKTNYPNLEILLVSNNSKERRTFRFLRRIEKIDSRIKVLEHNVPFNFSVINNWAVKQSRGEYILLLNNDMKVISTGWLEAMLEHIQQDNVGIVGAKLLYADNTVQHAGVIIGISGIAGHSHRFSPDTSNGYYYRPTVIQNLSAVTGACLLTKRELWDRVGGLEEEKFKVAFNDIDYCLKIRELGYDVVYTPYAKLYHYESKSRGPEDTPEKKERFRLESLNLIEKWHTNTLPDPYYNINLTHIYEDFSLDTINKEPPHQML